MGEQKRAAAASDYAVLTKRPAAQFQEPLLFLGGFPYPATADNVLQRLLHQIRHHNRTRRLAYSKTTETGRSACTLC